MLIKIINVKIIKLLLIDCMKILISDKLQEQGIQLFKENGYKVVENYTISMADLKREIEKFNAIVIRSRTKLTAEILENAKNLKVIGRAGVGLDNVDLKTAENLNIKVFNTPEAPSVSVAELTIGLLLSLVRFISKADQTMHRGQWHKKYYMGTTLKGKKVGIIGFGNIGQAVAKRMAAFEMKIGVFDVIPELINKAKEYGYVIYNSIDDLIRDAQIITLHVPALSSTKNMINQKRLNLMNEKTLLINTARGALIDEVALVDALSSKKIGGAALDVYKEEPLKNANLWKCDENLILTPHIGSSTIETQVNAAVTIAEKIINYFKNL